MKGTHGDHDMTRIQDAAVGIVDVGVFFLNLDLIGSRDKPHDQSCEYQHHWLNYDWSRECQHHRHNSYWSLEYQHHRHNYNAFSITSIIDSQSSSPKQLALVCITLLPSLFLNGDRLQLRVKPFKKLIYRSIPPLFCDSFC